MIFMIINTTYLFQANYTSGMVDQGRVVNDIMELEEIPRHGKFTS